MLAAKHVFELLKTPVYFYRKLRAALLWRAKARHLYKTKSGLQLHLGCGDQHLPGMLNCEYRATRAADVIMDCGSLRRFKENSVSLIFSSAFFEHLYRRQQIPLLKDCHRVLNHDGVVVFLMLPDFKVIAESYLSRLPGHPGRSEYFDLFQVYRYTHGDPEMAPEYWTQQLHKSLFDRDALRELLLAAGFRYWMIFNYAYPNEKIPLNLGFVAWKNRPVEQMSEFKKLLDKFRPYFADFNEPLIPANLMASSDLPPAIHPS